jgi:hypothetical protein
MAADHDVAARRVAEKFPQAGHAFYVDGVRGAGWAGAKILSF